MIGTKIGVYDIVAHLGQGGMGEVYRARDTRLKRDVALKVLPAAVASDRDRVARFEREAELLAALNHPNIANIYGVEDAGGTIALVMELVEGQTLAELIERDGHGLPVDEALRIAGQIADALEAAHERGIVHRDLKPANVKVRPDGTVKVLDFGLAKALERGIDGQGGGGDVSHSPTITSPAMTRDGVILGTAAYMAPEQARGRAVDKRADIWAFGGVLYEMLTGRRPFKGDGISDIIASVLRDEPDWTAIPTETPAAIRQVLRLCLQKDPARRLRDLSTVRLALDGAFDAHSPANGASAPASTTPAPAAPAATRLGLRLAWGAAAVLAAAVVGLVIASRTRNVTSAVALPVLRYEISGPSDVTLLQNAALSPDGRYIVFFTNTNNAATLWVRALDTLELKKLDGAPASVSSVAPVFFSPDSRSVAFWDGRDRKLKRIPIEGGVPQTICDAPNYAGGSWAPDGTIVYGTRGSGLFRVPASGGAPQPLTTLAAGEVGHINPSVLPDGAHLIFHPVHPVSETDLRSVILTGFDGKDRKALVKAAPGGDSGGALYSPPVAGGRYGYLVYRARTGPALMAKALDPRTFDPVGDEIVIAPNVGFFAVSPVGLLAYRAGTVTSGGSNRLVWMTRDGKMTDANYPVGDYQDLRVSPDGRRAVYAQRDVTTGPYDVWTIDLIRGVPSRFTIDPSDDRFPAWSPDGAWLIFATGVGRAHGRLMRRDIVSTGTEMLVDGGGDISAESISPDGEYALYRDTDASGGTDLMTVKIQDPPQRRRAIPFLNGPYNESNAAFRPGGTSAGWVAYVSDESGRAEVYLQSFPAGSGKLQVSSGGGREPRWRADGKELYYVGADRRLMAVPVTQGSPLDLGTATPLFQVGPNASASYGVAPDGRFLLVIPAGDSTSASTPQITITANWQAALRNSP